MSGLAIHDGVLMPMTTEMKCGHVRMYIPEGEALGHGVEVPDHDSVVLGTRREARAIWRPLTVPHLVAVLVQHLPPHNNINKGNLLEFLF